MPSDWFRCPVATEKIYSKEIQLCFKWTAFDQTRNEKQFPDQIAASRSTLQFERYLLLEEHPEWVQGNNYHPRAQPN